MRQVAKITCSSQVYFIVIFPCLPLVQSKPSFSLAKNIIVPNSPTYAWRTVFFLAKKLSNSTSPAYAWRTVFFHGKKYHRSKLSDLCVANRLFPWQKISSLQIIRLMRGELSFHLSAC